MVATTAAADLVNTLAVIGAELLIRCRTGRRLPAITRYHDGSWLSTIGTARVRAIDARIARKTSTGTRTGDYRLITTLLDPPPGRRPDHAVSPEVGDRDRLPPTPSPTGAATKQPSPSTSSPTNLDEPPTCLTERRSD
ncbi:hypothetical protein [Salinispora mooreana]|uniref:hypothetical protein n=1 Tax=Salinispora mooreana TaxID=999545 RepID=UPI0003A07779|nr:hypothetical protein [Salinispora mooreana]